MLRNLICTAALALCALCAPLQAGDVAEQMQHKKTSLYLKIDIEKAMSLLPEYLEALDAENGPIIVNKTIEARDALKEFSAAYEFNPVLFDKLDTVKAYLVIQYKDKPVTTTKMVEEVKYNFKDNNNEEEPETETVEKEVTETSYFTTALLLETDEDTATDFMEQMKVLRNNMVEKYPDQEKKYGYTELEVDSGMLMGNLDSDETLGCLGKYIIFSPENPTEIWSALQLDGIEDSLKDTKLYQRYESLSANSLMRLNFNVAEIVKFGEKILNEGLEEAKENTNDADQQEFGPSAVMIAQQQVKMFDFFKKTFSIDRILNLGVDESFTVSDKVSDSHMRATMELNQPIAEGLRQLLDGGEKLQPVAIDRDEDLLVMYRVGLHEIYQEVLKNLDQQQAQSFMGMMMMMKMYAGVDLNDIFPLLGGDFYVYVNMEEREQKQSEWDNDTGDFKDVVVTEPQPEFTVLYGLKDGEAFSAMLSGLFTRLSALPDMAQNIKKQVYQERDIYLVGPGISSANAEPNGFNSFALARVGRYFTMGSWESVTKFIRKSADGITPDKRFSQMLSDHTNAGMITFVPKEFVAKVNKFSEQNEAEGEKVFEKIISEMKLPVDDMPELEERIKTIMSEFLKAAQNLQKTSQKFIDDSSAISKLQGDYYEIICDYKVDLNAR